MVVRSSIWSARASVATIVATCTLIVGRADSASGDVLPVLSGPVVGVIDGDTIDVRLSSGMVRVRLYGIDAPEKSQPYGEKAKQALSELVFRKNVDLEVESQDRYDRVVAVVYVGDLDINAEMVKGGFAWAYRQYLGKLEGDEQMCVYEYAARGLKRGIWSLPAEQQAAPWDWRAYQNRRRDYLYDYAGGTARDCVKEIGRR
jgi:micrococcal nuclease